MEYTQLGNSGLLVSRLSFGAMTFTTGNRDFPALFKSDERTADKLVSMAIEAGVNFFDTADVYAAGESEEILGRVLASRRQDVVITTKVGGLGGPSLMGEPLSRRNILKAVDSSLQRLGTDWIDSYVLHRDDLYTPLEETLSALDEVVRSGKVRYLGFSNWSAWRVVAAMEMMKANGLTPFTHGQLYYSLVGRDIEHEHIPMLRQYGLGLTVWSPLAGGFLSGKYQRGADAAPDSRYAATGMMPLDIERGFDLLDHLASIAEAHHSSIAGISLAWLLAKQAVSSVILGAAKPDQLRSNLDSASIALRAEEIELLDKASIASLVPYPAWFTQFARDRRLASATSLRV
ncbi:aldo/keto reductase [Sphingobium phenoxybenzoativorans]|uniref:aldo/keto reductase n=1 Tax=Sphingobium phenoxybenzoativorans TaxID=1592790 RepID=UPI0008724A7E|nr:aldo/keto reductase [Sphingobium phenoxybenzoativorans]